jgi:8-oxo-dGTP pyrophosphatase MutT (NUDIX family)
VAIVVEGREPHEAHELAVGVSSADDEPILAAGGVLWRPAGDSFEILLIHRPRYDDWTLPKGKVDAGDADLLATAEREVREETGLRGRLGADLGEIHYTVKGRPKVVRYWAMELADDGSAGSTFEPNHEVDELAWLPPDEARARLVYLPDAEIVDRFLASWV